MDNTIKSEYTKMARVGARDHVVDRSKAYARWTVPSIMPEDNAENAENIKGSVSIGARLVNHLSNKVVDALFPVSRAFFTVQPTPQSEVEIERLAAQQGEVKEFIDAATARLEKAAIRELKLTEYRPKAVTAAKHLIVTGNVLLRRMKSKDRVIYPINRYAVERDMLGKEIKTILEDTLIASELDAEQDAVMRERRPGLKPDDRLTLLTRYTKHDKRWLIEQELDGVPVGEPAYQNERDYDLLHLVWNLNPGENYGRGLVEDQANIFHKLDVTECAINDIISIIADVRFLVKPSSILATRLQQFNESYRGSYHLGMEGDITVPELSRTLQPALETMLRAVDGLEQKLGQAFLISSVRDAERVTAEEIRLIATELEAAYGGIYSKLAVDWQQREAQFLIDNLNFKTELGKGALADKFDVVVTTGLETLSREGQLQALRLAIADLQMLEAVPEEIRAVIHPERFTAHVFNNRGITFADIKKTDAERQAEQQAQMQQQQAMLNQQAQANVSEEAGKQAAQQ